MSNQNFLRGASAVLALTAAAFAMNVSAQSANPTGPTNTNSNKAGEAYPNDPNAANPNKPTMKVITDVEHSKPAQETKKVAKKTTNTVKHAGHVAADETRHTGDKIAAKLPPEPAHPAPLKQ